MTPLGRWRRGGAWTGRGFIWLLAIAAGFPSAGAAAFSDLKALHQLNATDVRYALYENGSPVLRVSVEHIQFLSDLSTARFRHLVVERTTRETMPQTVHAGGGEYQPSTGRFRLEGGVQGHWADRTLKAPAASGHIRESRAQLDGPVRIESPEVQLEASGAVLDWRRHRLEADRVKLKMDWSRVQ